MTHRRPILAALLLLLAAPAAAQSSEAEAQYRVARRLAAEGSPVAGAAFARVVELDPNGARADDALVEQALLLGLPRWPEELGACRGDDVTRAATLLRRVVETFPQADRSREAAYRLGLLGLEPLAGYDLAGSRLRFLALAEQTHEDPWALAARHALGWLAEQSGEVERALATFQRIRVDAPQSAAAYRASAAVGRIQLRQQQPAAAAASFQQSLAGLPDDTPLSAQAVALRALAVDALLGTVRMAGALGIATEIRPSALAALPGHGALVAHRKRNEVVEFDATAGVLQRWPLEQPLAVSTTLNGLRFAISASAVWRLEPDGTSVQIGAPGSFGAFSSATVDGLGRVWVLDRRGEQVGRIDPGNGTPVSLWTEKGARLVGLVWDGSRLLSLDSRARRVLAIATDGSARSLPGEGLERPVALAADAAGRIAVLDARGAQVFFFDTNGAALGQFMVTTAGMQRAVALGFDPSGGLQLIDESSGFWWRVP